MAKPRPKMGSKDGKEFHYSVGVLIERDGKYLLIDRKNPPYGFASVAGHVDEGETPQEALVREVKEESGFDVIASKLLIEEFIPINRCVYNVDAHQWYVYEVEVDGEIIHNTTEARSIGWYTKKEISELVLEPVWERWFRELGILKS